MRGLVTPAVILAITLPPAPSLAEPQVTAAVTLGAAGRATEHHIWQETVLHLGVRSDVLFGRANVTNFGFGPYGEILTHSFDEIQVGAGGTGLVPIIDGFPIVLSAGAYGRYALTSGIEPGVAASFFWGPRSYNHHGVYNMAGGLLAQFRYGLGSSGETSIIISAQLDVVALSLPFQLVFNALRGGSNATRPIKK